MTIFGRASGSSDLLTDKTKKKKVIINREPSKNRSAYGARLIGVSVPLFPKTPRRGSQLRDWGKMFERLRTHASD